MKNVATLRTHYKSIYVLYFQTSYTYEGTKKTAEKWQNFPALEMYDTDTPVMH